MTDAYIPIFDDRISLGIIAIAKLSEFGWAGKIEATGSDAEKMASFRRLESILAFERCAKAAVPKGISMH